MSDCAIVAGCVLLLQLSSAAVLAADDGAAPEAAPYDDTHDAAPEVPRVTTPLQFTLTPGLWIPRLRGQTTLGSHSPVDVGDDLELDSAEATFNVEFSLRKREVWDLRFGGFAFSTDGDVVLDHREEFGELNLHPGDRVQSSIDITSVSAEIVAGTWRPFADAPGQAPNPENITPDGRYVVDFRIAPLFGVRYVDVQESVEARGRPQVDVEAEWLGVFGGVDVAMEYTPRRHLAMLDSLVLEAGVAAGPALGGDGGIIWQVRAGLTWNITPNLGTTIGYRLVEINADDGEYTFDAGVQGLFFAGVIRF